MYTQTFDQFKKQLGQLDKWLGTATDHAKSKNFDPDVFVTLRLAPDQFPLARQVQIACGHALRGGARLSGAEPMSLDDKATSFEDLKAVIAKTLEFLKSVDAKKMEGMEDHEITFPIGDGKMTLRGGDYLLHFSMPSFYFHVTTAYDILRHNGLEIGKDDFMGEA